ncbi:hypothetical protein C8Q78DRAFT_830386 [Trametes maxima]|nr:hypothetical protein C8Q78DRAFT_830386 [Trametes maxima]
MPHPLVRALLHQRAFLFFSALPFPFPRFPCSLNWCAFGGDSTVPFSLYIPTYHITPTRMSSHGVICWIVDTPRPPQPSPSCSA